MKKLSNPPLTQRAILESGVFKKGKNVFVVSVELLGVANEIVNSLLGSNYEIRLNVEPEYKKAEWSFNEYHSSGDYLDK